MTRTIALLVLLAGGLSVALGQDGEPAPREPEKERAPGKGDAGDGEPPRDPFSASDRMRDAEGSRFVPSDAPPALPGLVLRGFVEDAGGNSIALLEVDGKTTYLVRKGDTVNLPRAARNLVLRVVEIGNLELRVEVGELRRVVVVR